MSVAYLRMTTATQEEAAKAAGVSARTVRMWEASDWWRECCDEAGARWLAGLKAEARRGLFRGVGEDGNLALKVLERIDVGLEPKPKKEEKKDETKTPAKPGDAGAPGKKDADAAKTKPGAKTGDKPDDKTGAKPDTVTADPDAKADDKPEEPDTAKEEKEEPKRKDRVMLWTAPFGKDDVKIVWESEEHRFAGHSRADHEGGDDLRFSGSRRAGYNCERTFQSHADSVQLVFTEGKRR